jgi:phosphoribosyl-AMP cyclohydrolase
MVLIVPRWDTRQDARGDGRPCEDGIRMTGEGYVVDHSFLAAWVERLRTEIPNAAAVLLKGSHARGQAGLHSDVDFDVLVDREPVGDYLAYLMETGAGRLIHVSVAVQDLAGWLTEAREPVSWAFGLPADETTRLLWARDDSLRSTLDRPAQRHPPGEPELEDFVEAYGKVRNAFSRDDDLALRLAAQTLAGLCPSLLRLINPDARASHRSDALRAALGFPVAPDGYRDDMLVCLGLSGHATTSLDVRDAARRLTMGTLALLRTRAHHVDGALPPDLAGFLRDGTLERYVGQE